jgi:hypothetical protein
MNSTLEAVMRQCHGNSKSTDKLAIAMAGLECLPPAKLDKVKSLELNWKTEQSYDGDDVVVPVLKLEFFN